MEPAPADARYVLDERVRRVDGGGDVRSGAGAGVRGEVLLGGEPFRLLRLTPDGVRALDGLLGDGPPPARAGSAGALASRLVNAGVLHPVARPRPVGEGEVDVVVPVRDDAGRLARLLHALRPSFAGRILVVDDGSSSGPAARIAQAASRLGAELLRRSVSAGPAAARNAAGADRDGQAGASPLVAFVDSDVVPPAGWLEGLVGHLDRPGVGAVAPRVRAAPNPAGAGWLAGGLAAYESIRSPLDMGDTPAGVGAHRRVSYVPAAAVVCRRDALDEVGWFDPSLRVGEDVDLVRRLEAAGWAVRYEPAVTVWHDTRSGPLAFARQRFRYGTSAAGLERRHRGTVAPFEGSWWSLLGTAAALAARWRTASRVWDARVPKRPESRANKRAGAAIALCGVVATAVPARSLSRKLARSGVPSPGRTALMLIRTAERSNASGLAAALRRVWWPPALLAALLLRRCRRPIVAALAAAELSHGLGRSRVASRRLPDHSSRRSAGDEPDPAGWRRLPVVFVLGLVDDIAYGAGVWFGCVQGRSLRAVLPGLRRSAGGGAGVVKRSPTAPATS
jgi:mycofactocin system glycosyltransferase